MNIFTKAVHAGDRRKGRSAQIPSTTPIYLSSTYLADDAEQLDRLLGDEEPGFSYARYNNPTNAALEDLITSLEGGAGTLACSSGMMALQVALMAGLTDRRRHVLAANIMYGATMKMLHSIFEPFGVETTWIDICNLDAVRLALDEHKPGCLLMETICNPLMRVGPLDEIAKLCRERNVCLIVDSTFATPLLVRPLELGANIVVHSATKYLAGHGDVLGGLVTADADNIDVVRALARTSGPQLGPFESYLTMRGIKTFPLRMERQCQNACRVAAWLAQHPKVEKVYYAADPQHPDVAAIQRLFASNLRGAILSFAVKDAQKSDILALMDRLKLIVKGTSLGDVHTLVLYPLIASHRDLAPRQRQRMGIGDNLLRLSVGIESADDIIADLDQALS